MHAASVQSRWITAAALHLRRSGNVGLCSHLCIIPMINPSPRSFTYCNAMPLLMLMVRHCWDVMRIDLPRQLHPIASSSLGRDASPLTALLFFVRSIVVCVRCTGAAEIMPLPGSSSQATMERYLRLKTASSKVILITDDGERVIQSTGDDDDDAPMVAAPSNAVAAMTEPSAQSHFGSGAHQVSGLQAAAPTPTIVAGASTPARCNRATSKRKHSDASRRSRRHGASKKHGHSAVIPSRSKKQRSSPENSTVSWLARGRRQHY